MVLMLTPRPPDGGPMPTHRLRKAAWLAPVAVAVALPAAASAALPGAGHGFGGITNQSIFHRGDGGAVELRISKDGKRVARATATLRLTCTSGDSFVVPD